MPQLEFDEDFQGKIVSLMVSDLGFLLLAINTLEPISFSKKYLGWYFQTIKDHYLHYNIRISKEALKNELIKNVKSKYISDSEIPIFSNFYKELYNPVPDAEYIKNELVTFVKHQRFVAAVKQAVPLLQEKRIDEAYQLVEEAGRIDTSSLDVGLNFFRDYKDILEHSFDREECNIFPTGIGELDKYLSGGGLMQKEMGVVLAPTNRGKSIALCAFGKRAIISGYKVVHYTLEMSQKKVAHRYFSSWSGVPYNDLWKERKGLIERSGDLYKMYGDSLYIKEFPSQTVNINTIKHNLRMLSSYENFHPDLIILDYGELLRATKNYKDDYQEQSHTFSEIRGLASEMNMGVWTATQSNRKSLSKNIVTMEDMADSFKKAAHADIIIALCQTPEEYKANLMRIFIAKNRDNVKEVSITIKNDFSRMAFGLDVVDVMKQEVMDQASLLTNEEKNDDSYKDGLDASVF